MMHTYLMISTVRDSGISGQCGGETDTGVVCPNTCPQAGCKLHNISTCWFYWKNYLLEQLTDR